MKRLFVVLRELHLPYAFWSRFEWLHEFMAHRNQGDYYESDELICRQCVWFYQIRAWRGWGS